MTIHQAANKLLARLSGVSNELAAQREQMLSEARQLAKDMEGADLVSVAYERVLLTDRLIGFVGDTRNEIAEAAAELLNEPEHAEPQVRRRGLPAVGAIVTARTYGVDNPRTGVLLAEEPETRDDPGQTKVIGIAIVQHVTGEGWVWQRCLVRSNTIKEASGTHLSEFLEQLKDSQLSTVDAHQVTRR